MELRHRLLILGLAARTLLAAGGSTLREGCLTMKLSQRWNKERILGEYPNVVYYGNRACAAEAAAQAYFSVSAAWLTLARAAPLAGLARVAALAARPAVLVTEVRPGAGKTGTTDSRADAWFARYTPELAAAVRVGHPEGARPLAPVAGGPVTGGTGPGRLALAWGRRPYGRPARP